MKKAKTADKPKANNRKPSTGKTVEGKKKGNTKSSKAQGDKKRMSVFTDLIPVRIKKHRDKNGGHHHVILEDFENKHVSVGLTTKPKKGKNATNYKCEVNPLGGNGDSYMRRQGTVASQKEYEPTERKGKMSPKDYARAKEYGDKAKQKHLEKGNKKSNDVPNT